MRMHRRIARRERLRHPWSRNVMGQPLSVLQRSPSSFRGCGNRAGNAGSGAVDMRSNNLRVTITVPGLRSLIRQDPVFPESSPALPKSGHPLRDGFGAHSISE